MLRSVCPTMSCKQFPASSAIFHMPSMFPVHPAIPGCPTMFLDPQYVPLCPVIPCKVLIPCKSRYFKQCPRISATPTISRNFQEVSLYPAIQNVHSKLPQLNGALFNCTIIMLMARSIAFRMLLLASVVFKNKPCYIYFF